MFRRAMLISVMAFGALVTPIADEPSAHAASHVSPALGMPDSRTLNLPVLATGQLQNPDGAPATGMVVAYAWPTNIPMRVGDKVTLTPVPGPRLGTMGGSRCGPRDRRRWSGSHPSMVVT